MTLTTFLNKVIRSSFNIFNKRFYFLAISRSTAPIGININLPFSIKFIIRQYIVDFSANKPHIIRILAKRNLQSITWIFQFNWKIAAKTIKIIRSFLRISTQ